MLTYQLAPVGTKITFTGRRNAKVIAEVVKRNPSRAKCKVISSTGYGHRGDQPGAIWNVGYSVMTLADPKAAEKAAALMPKSETLFVVTGALEKKKSEALKLAIFGTIENRKKIAAMVKPFTRYEITIKEIQ